MLVVTSTCDQAAFKNRYLMCVEVDGYHLTILGLSQLKLLMVKKNLMSRTCSQRAWPSMTTEYQERFHHPRCRSAVGPVSTQTDQDHPVKATRNVTTLK